MVEGMMTPSYLLPQLRTSTMWPLEGVLTVPQM